MMKRARVLVAIVLVGSFALLAVGCTASEEASRNASNANGNKEGTNYSSAGAVAADMEPRFILEAAKSGIAEVELGRMAVQKASDEEVRQFGQRMVADHSRANGEVKQLASQKNVTLPSEMDPSHQEIFDRLGKLTPAEFDRAYMTEMVKDHTRAVADFEQASTQAQDADVKGFASKALPTLREHLDIATAINERVAAESKPKLRRVGNTNTP